MVQGSVKAIKLLLFVPVWVQDYVENTFYASFPTSQLKKLWVFATPKFTSHTFLKPSYDATFFGTQEFSQWWSYVDPFKEVLSYYQTVSAKDRLEIVWSVQFDIPVSLWGHIVTGIKKVKDLFGKKEESTDSDDAKIDSSKHPVSMSISYNHRGEAGAGLRVKDSIAWLFGKFVATGKISLRSRAKKFIVERNSFSNMFHLPTKANQNTSLRYVNYRKLPPPTAIPLANWTEEDLTVLGTTEYKADSTTFWIRKEDKFRHVYIVGKTGMGKSTFISNMVRSDMHRNNGIAVVDPHGDLIEDVMAHIPSHRTNDVVIFDVSDTDYPVGFNILEYQNDEQKNLVASGVISIFKKLYGHSRWPRLEYILRNVMLSVLEYPNATLMHITRMLTDKNFREEVLRHVTDPVVTKFWRDEYDKRNDKQQNEAVWPITNKIWQFLSSTIVRNIFAQPKSHINIRKIMDEWKILLVNLSKWRIWEDNAAMIGSFLVTKFQIDAMSRADIDYKKRKDFYLYIDEFQNFATDSFESILSEARKYRLSLIVANQYTSQIQENVRNAIFGNVWTIVSFGLGYDDATIMSQQFKELIVPNDLLSLPKFKAYIKLMVDGVTVDPFTMGTLPLPDPELSDEIKLKIRTQSRQRYSMEKVKLEQLLKAWAEKQFTKSEKVVEKAKRMAVKTDGSSFGEKDIVTGKVYDGIIKLKYNYGVFVTVRWVEGLLHKSQITVPKSVDSRKGLYEIGDAIRVKALERKDVKWEKKIVWWQE